MKTRFDRYICENAHVENVPQGADAERARFLHLTQISCFLEADMSGIPSPRYAIMTAGRVEFSGTMEHLCPTCGSVQNRVGAFRGTTTTTACEAVCQRATGGDCRCSCGGSQHGVIA